MKGLVCSLAAMQLYCILLCQPTGIIYCLSCKDTEQLSDDLRANGIKSACYHANLSPEARTCAHSQWLNDDIQVMRLVCQYDILNHLPSNIRFIVATLVLLLFP